MNCGNKIKEFRTKKHILQDKLAIELSDEEYQISKKQISMWERGKELPDTLSLIRLADYFGATTDELLGRTECMDGEKMGEIIKQAISLAEQKKYEEWFQLWREEIQRYPGDYWLKNCYAMFLDIELFQSQLTYVIKENLQDECISICNQILNYCTDERIRSAARFYLVKHYNSKRSLDLAFIVAKKTPKVLISRLDLLKTVAERSNKTSVRSELAIERFEVTMSTLVYLSEQFKGSSNKDIIGLESVKTLWDILLKGPIMELSVFCDKKTVQKTQLIASGRYFCFISLLVSAYACSKDTDKTLEYLSLAKRQAERYLSNLSIYQYNANIKDIKELKINDIVNLSDPIFDFLRKDERFIELEKSLKSFDESKDN